MQQVHRPSLFLASGSGGSEHLPYEAMLAELLATATLSGNQQWSHCTLFTLTSVSAASIDLAAYISPEAYRLMAIGTSVPVQQKRITNMTGLTFLQQQQPSCEDFSSCCSHIYALSLG